MTISHLPIVDMCIFDEQTFWRKCHSKMIYTRRPSTLTIRKTTLIFNWSINYFKEMNSRGDSRGNSSMNAKYSSNKLFMSITICKSYRRQQVQIRRDYSLRFAFSLSLSFFFLQRLIDSVYYNSFQLNSWIESKWFFFKLSVTLQL